MSKPKNVCDCPQCTNTKEMKMQEWQLHLFVGQNPSNIKSEWIVFERNLIFDIAISWDVGFCNAARYTIYSRGDGELVAWYDNIKKCGYSIEFTDCSF